MDDVDLMLCELLSTDEPLPPLTAEERAAMESLPKDFAKRILEGERALFGTDGKFAGWRSEA